MSEVKGRRGKETGERERRRGGEREEEKKRKRRRKRKRQLKTPDKNTTTAPNDANEQTQHNKKRVPTTNPRNDLVPRKRRYHTDSGSNHDNQNPKLGPEEQKRPKIATKPVDQLDRRNNPRRRIILLPGTNYRLYNPNEQAKNLES